MDISFKRQMLSINARKEEDIYDFRRDREDEEANAAFGELIQEANAEDKCEQENPSNGPQM